MAVICRLPTKVFQLCTKGIIWNRWRDVDPSQKHGRAKVCLRHKQRMDRRSRFLPLTVGIPEKPALKLRGSSRVLAGGLAGGHGPHPASLPAVSDYRRVTTLLFPSLWNLGLWAVPPGLPSLPVNQTENLQAVLIGGLKIFLEWRYRC